jgi:starch-binding outer membrane protein SusE/F
MKKNLIIYLTVIGLIGLFSSCENDETRVVMSGNPVLPTIVTMPDLTLTRTNGTNVLTFVGSPVDPGFQASVIYYLEACPSGNKFVNVTSILSSPQDAELKITVSDLNGILLKAFPADQVSTVDFRIRSVLVADAGTGVSPLVFSSPTKPAQVTLYGLPRLDLIGSGIDQKIESALGDGKYKSYVKLDAANAFTLKDPDAGTVYGGAAGVLSVGGPAIAVDAAIGSGWYNLSANTTDLTYVLTPYMIGLVGSATPNAWNSPDQKMNYDAATATWKITIDLIAGDIKFRVNDGWAWNLGGTTDKLTVDGSNITLAAGNYTIVLTITNPNSVKGEVGGFCTITKN